MILDYFLSLIHHPTRELNLMFDVYYRVTKAFRAIAPSSVVFQKWLEHLDWTKVKRKKRKVKVETRLPPLSLFSSKHTRVTTMGKTISGSSSSCFLPPLLLHCPQVPPILRPDGLLISPKDPREEWWTKKFSLSCRGYTMTWFLSSLMFNGLLEQGHVCEARWNSGNATQPTNGKVGR